MDHLNLTNAKENRKTKSALCAISGKTFGGESVLTALFSEHSVVVLSVGSINVEQRVVENP